tara:strand:- start:417 stop:551 length:135 start_codon:yes stop_codon:yes gene_type:complete
MPVTDQETKDAWRKKVAEAIKGGKSSSKAKSSGKKKTSKEKKNG